MPCCPRQPIVVFGLNGLWSPFGRRRDPSLTLRMTSRELGCMLRMTGGPLGWMAGMGARSFADAQDDKGPLRMTSRETGGFLWWYVVSRLENWACRCMVSVSPLHPTGDHEGPPGHPSPRSPLLVLMSDVCIDRLSSAVEYGVDE